MRYRYTGSVPQEFPTLGRRLAPGDVIDLDAPVTCAWLEPEAEAPPPPPARKEAH